MKWSPGRRSGNVRDARTGRGRGAAVGGGAVGTVGLLSLLVVMCTGDTSLLEGMQVPSPAEAPSVQIDQETFESDTDDFIEAVVVDLEIFWDQTFAEYDLQYNDATFTFFDSPIRTGCGQATAAIGPHYCPVDNGIYLELGFFDQLSRQFGAPGDAAQAYVVGHEFAHHVQNEIGYSDAVRSRQARSPRLANQYSVALELQADCLAGVWMGSFVDRASDLQLERGDLEEALTAAAAVGDDSIQAKTTGQIQPHKWTHGSAEQRQEWFYLGFDSVDTEVCETFTAYDLDL